MKRVLLLSSAVALLALAGGGAGADIIVLKNGNIIEGTVTGSTVKKVPGQGGPRTYIQVTVEDGSKKEFWDKDIQYMVKRKCSWIVKAEEKDWYGKKAPTIKPDWKSQEKFAKECKKQKKYLEDEALVHFKKAYEGRKPEMGDTIGEHERMARTLENDYGLYEEAGEEWRWVYAKKLESVVDVTGHVTLAKWCTKEGLYDEAMAEYTKALEKEPGSMAASSGMEKLKKALEVPVVEQMYRIVRAPMQKSVGWLLAQQQKDGSFGGDITEAGVHGKHGISALAGLALLAQWEFDILDDFDKSDSPPAGLKNLLAWTIANHETGSGLAGEDVWGPIFRLEFLARCYRKRPFESSKEAIKKRAIETIEELRTKARSDGGWAYYTFVQTGITFLTASGIVALVEAKEAGLPVDDAMIAKACSMVKGVKQGAGQYSYRPGTQEEAVGCAGRSSLVEYALLRAGQGGDALPTAINNFFQYRHLLEAIKGQEGTHIGQGMTAPYYYLFGHYWTTRAVQALPKSARMGYLKKMAEVFMKDQEPTGVFWDTPLTKVNKDYGTALGILTYYQLAAELRRSDR